MVERNAVIIVAAGRGERAGREGGPKQYRMLGGKSVLARTISQFANHPAIDRILVVVHKDDHALYQNCTELHPKLLAPCNGGESRQASVLEGLRTLKDQNIQNILIHDAARPFVDADLINRVIEKITPKNGALPVLPLSDTIKQAANGMVVKTIPRDNLFAAQTPQGFNFISILDAHERAAHEAASFFTDDASIAEWVGMTVTLVAGDPANRKLTIAEDFAMAGKILAVLDVRTGNGYDVHAFEPGDHVRLCGVDIAHSASLKGHSDADVGLHALTDALFGTIGDGDIGSHFPPSDEQWRDANSEQFFKHAVARVRAKIGTITHLDVTLICEEPKIGPHRDVMRREIARMAEIAMERVSVKATTHEKIGSIGRKEGIAAIATATVVIAT